MTKITGSKNLQELRTVTEPWILRRTIPEVEVDLPAVQVREIWLDLLPEQQTLYRELRKSTKQILETGHPLVAK